jgi:hypothetical protein
MPDIPLIAAMNACATVCFATFLMWLDKAIFGIIKAIAGEKYL